MLLLLIIVMLSLLLLILCFAFGCIDAFIVVVVHVSVAGVCTFVVMRL